MPGRRLSLSQTTLRRGASEDDGNAIFGFSGVRSRAWRGIVSVRLPVWKLEPEGSA